jgi:hypothetical protein
VFGFPDYVRDGEVFRGHDRIDLPGLRIEKRQQALYLTG